MNAERRPARRESAGTTPTTDDESDGPSPEPTQGPPDPRPATGPGRGPGDAAAAQNGPGGGDEAPGAVEEEPQAAPDGGDEPDEGAEEVAVETEETLLVQLEDVRRELENEREAALRARAEVENVRRRAARDVEQAHRFGLEGIVGELLPIRDGLELGARAAKEEGSTVESLAEGTEMTLRMLTGVLEKFGAVEVNPEGEDFDPSFHQAMSMSEAEGVASGKVLQVFQKGYLLNGRVVRPAMVIVAK